ncbi:WAT1-related protein [Acorus gramineus]|uniref:WAT1-related protein n=1 Tax=Acorus gramineus TaxID=55184 RepID=A0AAV9BHL4_ACOGR|nr:WAT1-related protein [Acorus gramineus]
MDKKKPYLVLIVIQSIYAGMYMLSKAAFNEGMSTYVFVFYRQSLATIFLAPIALIFERKTAPPLPFTTFFKMFLLSLIGITFSLNLYGFALNYTSAALASATSNMIPVITFFLSILLGMETVKLKRASGISKLTGVAICAAGAITIAFYKGPSFKSFSHHHLSTHHSSSRAAHAVSAQPTKKWIEGTFLMILCNTTWSMWIVFQGRLMQEYPAKLLFTTLQCLCSAVQSFFVAIAFERDLSRWMLGFDVGLVAVAYSGIVVSGFTYYLQGWCIAKRGPVFLAMSMPLAFMITIVGSSFALGEVISLGSALGGALMIGGLYSVLWGKNKEQKDLRLLVQDTKECLEEKEIKDTPFQSV